MSEAEHQDRQRSPVEEAVAGITLPGGVRIRAWEAADFAPIQQLSTAEGWPTPEERPEETLAAWHASWPTLVLLDGQEVIGFLRALSDGQVTTYIAEILVAPGWRGGGLGQALLEACHRLCPSTRLDLLSTGSSEGFYAAAGFRPFQAFRRSYRQR